MGFLSSIMDHVRDYIYSMQLVDHLLEQGYQRVDFPAYEDQPNSITFIRVRDDFDCDRNTDFYTFNFGKDGIEVLRGARCNSYETYSHNVFLSPASALDLFKRDWAMEAREESERVLIADEM